jgi:t-SNARE complex subunit (syntaxin)
MQARILSGNVANEKVSNAARDAIEMYKDMVKLEESVEQVSVMFQEMATLVELQAPLLDNILMNMEQAEEIVGKGMGELGKIKRINKKRWF